MGHPKSPENAQLLRDRNGRRNNLPVITGGVCNQHQLPEENKKIQGFNLMVIWIKHHQTLKSKEMEGASCVSNCVSISTYIESLRYLCLDNVEPTFHPLFFLDLQAGFGEPRPTPSAKRRSISCCKIASM